MNNNEVTNFLFYVYNKWSKEESVRLFGNDLGNHIFNKWVEKHEYSNDITMSWYADLDKKCRQKIVDRANELYNK
jgi:hypothetical protein